jgi:L-lactate utilization protein LutC
MDLNVIQCNLEKRKFTAVTCKTKADAVDFIDKNFEINAATVVGMGNSLTLDTLRIKEKLARKTAKIFQHAPDSSYGDTANALLADYYFTSANALSESGEIVNIDGTGNRVAATCYGAKQVVFVIGKNKIAANLEEAVSRARNIAAVENARRYNRKTPCVVTGKCENCLSPECLCSIITIHRQQPLGNKILVILVDENLGF